VSTDPIWLRLDVTMPAQAKIAELGAEFGPAGIAVPVVLLCATKAQEISGGPLGHVEHGWRALERAAYMRDEDGPVRALVHAAARVRLLEVVREDDLEFTAFFPGWARRQPAIGGRQRTAEWRARQETVTARDVSSQNVTARRLHKTEDKDIEDSLRSSSVESPNGDARELFAYWQRQCGHPNAKPTRDRLAKVRARLSEGYTAEQVRQAIDGAARAAFVNDAGKRFDDLELICRNGSKLEDFMSRSTARAKPQLPNDAPDYATDLRRWVTDHVPDLPADRALNVLARLRTQAARRGDRESVTADDVRNRYQLDYGKEAA
jgi:hypothetical protein